jgi:formate--tetrahydrofolate ligase
MKLVLLFLKALKKVVKLAKVVHEVIEKEKKSLFKPLYNEEMSLKEKIETIAKEIYRATGIVYSTKALSDLKKIESLKIEDLKICMAKTQYSFSEDPNLRNAPDGHILNIKEIEMAIGAGFIVPIVGTMLRMPGLPNIPQAVNITIDDEGIIEGLS